MIDSHCHLDMIDLTPYGGRFDELMSLIDAQGVSHMLCVSVSLERYPAMRELAAPYSQVSFSVGVHPGEPDARDPEVDELVELASDPRIVAIGETGLDYYRAKESEIAEMEWQRERFRRHIRAARAANKPLIIHTRAAKEETLRILEEEGADQVGGVLHCFTEDWPMARRGIELGFFVSFSGIVTFRNAAALREVAAQVPDERLLIETDSPYLAPIPHRGKPNQPGWVRHVAEQIAELRSRRAEEIIELTSSNFQRLFGTC